MEFETLDVARPERHVMQSKYNERSFEIFVQLPPRFPARKERFPVLYMLDSYGEMKFSQLTHAMHFGEVNRFITVGIGYPEVQSPFHAASFRSRDLSFQTLEVADYLIPLAMGEPMVNSGPKSGCGDQLLEFIQEQLVPFINANYPTDPTDNGLYGFSLAGAFALEAMLLKPSLFQKYIIGSPAWSFNNDDGLIERLSNFSRSGGRIEADMFLSVGSAEQSQRIYRTSPMDLNLVEKFHQLAECFERLEIPGLDVSTKVFEGQPHACAGPLAYIFGAQKLYGWVPHELSWPESSGIGAVT